MTVGRPEVDLLVVGGGPVGLAAAVEARLAGLDVVVVDPRGTPVDKACGEGVMPGGVAALARLGVEPAGRPFVGIAYRSGGRAVRAEFRHGPGLGVRRLELSRALAERADAVGVERRTTRVTALEATASGVRAGGVHAAWVLACDGLHSPVRRMLRLDRQSRGPQRYGLRRHYAVQPWGDVVEVHWSADSEAYVTPVADDCVGVALLGGPGGSFDERLAGFPALAERLAGADAASSVLGAGPLRRRVAARVSGRVLLAGDAAGYVDALTGEGLAVGLVSARAAVAAVVDGRPERYERDWRRLTRRSRLLTGAVLVAATHAPSRRLVVPAATALPRVFAGVVDALAADPWPDVGGRA